MSEAVAEREGALRQARARAAASATGWAMATTQVLFLSFAVGAAIGPAPLRPAEFFAGAVGAIALGVIIATFTVRRRLEGAALVVLGVREGGRSHRMSVFRDHLVLGDEVIARERVRAASSDGLELHLEVHDPAEAGVCVRRSFRGPRHLLSRAADALRSV